MAAVVSGSSQAQAEYYQAYQQYYQQYYAAQYAQYYSSEGGADGSSATAMKEHIPQTAGEAAAASATSYYGGLFAISATEPSPEEFAPGKLSIVIYHCSDTWSEPGWPV